MEVLRISQKIMKEIRSVSFVIKLNILHAF